jgi:adenylate cyclase
MVTLNAALPLAHGTLSLAYLWEKQYEQTSIEAEQTLALNPNHGAIYAVLAGVLGFLGRPEEALGLVEKALRLSPRLPPRSLLHLGHTYYLAGRTEEAIAVLKESLNGSPADLDAHLLLAAVYSELGRDAEARAEAAAVLRINPSWSLDLSST